MKSISKEEIENIVRDLIDGNTTRKKLAKELRVGIRTINTRIRELSETNPELYEEYIKKFPYRPRKREDIDFEALVIDVMKSRSNMQDIPNRYHVSVRTISRRMVELESTNPDLVQLYRSYVDAKRKSQDLPYTIEEEIEKLGNREVVLSDITDKREIELREILSSFEELIGKGMSKAEAAKKLGHEEYASIWKKYKELQRIETEKKTSNKSKSFRGSMKANPSNNQDNQDNKGINNEENIVIGYEELEGR